MQSQLRQQLQKSIARDREEGQQEFEPATGLNIERDIDRVVGVPRADHGAGRARHAG